MGELMDQFKEIKNQTVEDMINRALHTGDDELTRTVSIVLFCIDDMIKKKEVPHG